MRRWSRKFRLIFPTPTTSTRAKISNDWSHKIESRSQTNPATTRATGLHRRRRDRYRLVLVDGARQAAADRRTSGSRKNRNREGAGQRTRYQADSSPVLRRSRRYHRALRMELPETVAAPHTRRSVDRVGSREGR